MDLQRDFSKLAPEPSPTSSDNESRGSELTFLQDNKSVQDGTGIKHNTEEEEDSKLPAVSGILNDNNKGQNHGEEEEAVVLPGQGVNKEDQSDVQTPVTGTLKRKVLFGAPDHKEGGQYKSGKVASAGRAKRAKKVSSPSPRAKKTQADKASELGAKTKAQAKKGQSTGVLSDEMAQVRHKENLSGEDEESPVMDTVTQFCRKLCDNYGSIYPSTQEEMENVELKFKAFRVYDDWVQNGFPKVENVLTGLQSNVLGVDSSLRMIQYFEHVASRGSDEEEEPVEERVQTAQIQFLEICAVTKIMALSSESCISPGVEINPVTGVPLLMEVEKGTLKSWLSYLNVCRADLELSAEELSELLKYACSEDNQRLQWNRALFFVARGILVHRFVSEGLYLVDGELMDAIDIILDDLITKWGDMKKMEKKREIERMVAAERARTQNVVATLESTGIGRGRENVEDLVGTAQNPVMHASPPRDASEEEINRRGSLQCAVVSLVQSLRHLISTDVTLFDRFDTPMVEVEKAAQELRQSDIEM